MKYPNKGTSGLVVAVVLIAPIVSVVTIFGILGLQETGESEVASEIALSEVKLSTSVKQILKKELDPSAISKQDFENRYTVYRLLSISASTNKQNVYIEGNRIRRRALNDYLLSVFQGGLKANLHTRNRKIKYKVRIPELNREAGDLNPSGSGTRYVQNIYLKNGERMKVEVMANTQGGKGFYR